MAEDTMYLTIARDPNSSGWIAAITMGQPQLGDNNVTLLTIEVLKSRTEAREWFERMKIEKPWETRQ